MQSITIPEKYLDKLLENKDIRFVVLKEVPTLGDFTLVAEKKRLKAISWRLTTLRLCDALPEDLAAWDNIGRTELLEEMKTYYGKTFKEKDIVTVMEFDR